MPIDPSIYNMVGKFPQIEVPDPLERQTRLAQLKQLAMQGEMGQMQLGEAKAKHAKVARANSLLAKHRGDVQKAAQEAAEVGDYETANEFQTMIKSRAQTDAVYQKSVSEAQEAYLKASKEERAAVQAGLEDLAKGIQWVEQGNPEELPARYARFVQHYPPQVREKYGMGPQYDPSIGGLIKARAQAWGDVSKSGGTPASAVGKIMEDYKRGFYGTGPEAIQLRDAAIKDATTKGPGVTVGVNPTPVVGIDPATGKEIFFRTPKGSGPAEILPNVVPPKKGKTAEDESKLQSVVDGTNNILGTLDRLKAHKGLRDVVGALTGDLRSRIPGTDAADFAAQLDTFKAQAFLPMVQSMKGMGALSENEGKKLTDAVGALSVKMKPENFIAELNRIQAEMKAKAARFQKQMDDKYGESAPRQPQPDKHAAQSKVSLAEVKKSIAPGGKYAGKTIDQVKAALKSRGIEVE